MAIPIVTTILLMKNIAITFITLAENKQRREKVIETLKAALRKSPPNNKSGVYWNVTEFQFPNLTHNIVQL